MDLESRWSSLCQRLAGADAPVVQTLYTCLTALYDHPPRRYHSLDHVRSCLALLDRFRQLADDADAVETAIFLHDCICRPGRSDNEQRSAIVARMMLRELGAASEKIERVARLVLATRHVDPPADADSALIQDIDLATLGSDAAEYDRYADAIREEFAEIPEADFHAGRARFLRAMLARPQVYSTAAFRHAFEAAARANMERALSELQD